MSSINLHANRTSFVVARLVAATLFTAVVALSAGRGMADEPLLVFFGWSDQHVQTDGDGSHVEPMVEALNDLPGTAYPEEIGGSVEEPAFVFGCGDITEWPTTAARDTYDALLEKLKYPAFDVLGNHDDGGKSPSDTMKAWAVKRHGALSYTFDKNGVRFICAYSEYDHDVGNPAQPITDEALRWIKDQLDEAGNETPVVVATHLCFDAITNRDEVVDVLQGHNVLAVLGGHYHKAVVSEYRGVHFIQLPSPKSKYSDVTVLRAYSDRLEALVYDYREKHWRLDPRVSLVNAVSNDAR